MVLEYYRQVFNNYINVFISYINLQLHIHLFPLFIVYLHSKRRLVLNYYTNFNLNIFCHQIVSIAFKSTREVKPM